MTDFKEVLIKKAAAMKADRDAVFKQIQDGQAKYQQLNEAIAGIDALLRYEGVAPVAVVAAPASQVGGPELYDVLNEVVDTRIRSVEELVDIVKSKGVQFGDKDPYKTVNFTLIGMSRGKKIVRTVDGKWSRAAA